MARHATNTLLLLLTALTTVNAYWLMGIEDFITTERLDPIVNPGKVSGHVHSVLGGSNFRMNTNTANLRNSECTSIPIPEDKSNYWFPHLYFQWNNGSFTSLDGGAVIYYLFNDKPGTTTAFPDDFRMLSGDPTLRTYDPNSYAQQAVTFLCLDFDGTTTRHNSLPAKTCPSGVRAQINFPSCWDGKNLDSSDHKSHVAFLSGGPDSGTCSDPKFPVTLPRIFIEVYWASNVFDSVRSQAMNPSQPFVYAYGDPTGYGYHADFINGWDKGVLQNAVDKCHCNIYGDPTCCVDQGIFHMNKDQHCRITKAIDERTTGTLDKLPGNNPVQKEGARATMFPDNTHPVLLEPIFAYTGDVPSPAQVGKPVPGSGSASSSVPSTPSSSSASSASSSSPVAVTSSTVAPSSSSRPSPPATSSSVHNTPPPPPSSSSVAPTSSPVTPSSSGRPSPPATSSSVHDTPPPPPSSSSVAPTLSPVTPSSSGRPSPPTTSSSVHDAPPPPPISSSVAPTSSPAATSSPDAPPVPPASPSSVSASPTSHPGGSYTRTEHSIPASVPHSSPAGGSTPTPLPSPHTTSVAASPSSPIGDSSPSPCPPSEGATHTSADGSSPTSNVPLPPSSGTGSNNPGQNPPVQNPPAQNPPHDSSPSSPAGAYPTQVASPSTGSGNGSGSYPVDSQPPNHDPAPPPAVTLIAGGGIGNGTPAAPESPAATTITFPGAGSSSGPMCSGRKFRHKYIKAQAQKKRSLRHARSLHEGGRRFMKSHPRAFY